MSALLRSSVLTGFSLLLAFPALSQTFDGHDIPAIVAASQANEIRFSRDYKGRQFSATMPLRSISENMFMKGNYLVTFGTSAFGSNVDCKVSDPSTLTTMADWNKGQMVKGSGIIEETLMGDIQLSNCKYLVP
jgi:hypothetical protein